MLTGGFLGSPPSVSSLQVPWLPLVTSLPCTCSPTALPQTLTRCLMAGCPCHVLAPPSAGGPAEPLSLSLTAVRFCNAYLHTCKVRGQGRGQQGQGQGGQGAPGVLTVLGGCVLRVYACSSGKHRPQGARPPLVLALWAQETVSRPAWPALLLPMQARAPTATPHASDAWALSWGLRTWHPARGSCAGEY